MHGDVILCTHDSIKSVIAFNWSTACNSWMRIVARTQDGAACPRVGFIRAALSDLHRSSYTCCVLVTTCYHCSVWLRLYDIKCKGIMVGSNMRVKHRRVFLLYIMIFSLRCIFYGILWLRCFWISDIHANKLSGKVASINSFWGGRRKSQCIYLHLLQLAKCAWCIHIATLHSELSLVELTCPLGILYSRTPY